MKYRNDVTLERLRELLSWDPELVQFTRLVVTSTNTKIGQRAGYMHRDGYRRITIDGVQYLEHRLVWLYMTGRWPAQWLDHRDGNPANNAWTNLREATPAQNMANSRRHWNKKSGLPKGVYRNGKRFQACLGVKGYRSYLGHYDTLEQAYEAYMKAAQAHYGEFARAA